MVFLFSTIRVIDQFLNNYRGYGCDLFANSTSIKACFIRLQKSNQAIPRIAISKRFVVILTQKEIVLCFFYFCLSNTLV